MNSERRQIIKVSNWKILHESRRDMLIEKKKELGSLSDIEELMLLVSIANIEEAHRLMDPEERRNNDSEDDGA